MFVEFIYYNGMCCAPKKNLNFTLMKRRKAEFCVCSAHTARLAGISVCHFVWRVCKENSALHVTVFKFSADWYAGCKHRSLALGTHSRNHPPIPGTFFVQVRKYRRSPLTPSAGSFPHPPQGRLIPPQLSHNTPPASGGNEGERGRGGRGKRRGEGTPKGSHVPNPEKYPARQSSVLQQTLNHR